MTTPKWDLIATEIEQRERPRRVEALREDRPSNGVTPQLEESFVRSGMQPAKAKIAAAGRHSRSVPGTLLQAGQRLGLVPAAALTFARGRFLEALTKKEPAGGTWPGGNFPATDYAYVGDAEDPETWELLLTFTPGGEMAPKAVRSAVLAIDPSTQSPNPVPEDALPDVKTKLAKAWAKAIPDEELPAVLSQEALRRAFRGIGLSESSAAIAARGRERRS